MNSRDYFLWGLLKGSTYSDNPYIAEEIKGDIATAVKIVSEETLAAVMEEFS
jgi:hypothetical protein